MLRVLGLGFSVTVFGASVLGVAGKGCSGFRVGRPIAPFVLHEPSFKIWNVGFKGYRNPYSNQ